MLTIDTASSAFGELEACAVQVLPPSAVVRTEAVGAPAPTVQQVSKSTQLMPLSFTVTPEVCADQVVPASVVAMTTPPSPTAMQSVASAQETPLRFWPVPDVATDHVVPPLAVTRTLPLWPTATHEP